MTIDEKLKMRENATTNIRALASLAGILKRGPEFSVKIIEPEKHNMLRDLNRGIGFVISLSTTYCQRFATEADARAFLIDFDRLQHVMQEHFNHEAAPLIARLEAYAERLLNSPTVVVESNGVNIEVK